MKLKELINEELQNTFEVKDTNLRVELALTPIYKDKNNRLKMLIMKRGGIRADGIDKIYVYFNSYDAIFNGSRQFVSQRCTNRFYTEEDFENLLEEDCEIFNIGISEEINADGSKGYFLTGFILIKNVNEEQIRETKFITSKNYDSIDIEKDKITNLIFDIEDDYETIYKHLYSNIKSQNISYEEFLNSIKNSPNSEEENIILNGQNFGENALFTPKMKRTIKALLNNHKIREYSKIFFN